MDERRSARVLVVDAEPASRRGFSEIIRSHPSLEVCAAVGTMHEARLAAQASQPLVALVDAGIDGGSGYLLIGELETWSPGIRIIMVTRRNDADTAQRTLRAGASGVITRWESEQVILDAFAAALRQEWYVGPQVQQSILKSFAGVAASTHIEIATRLSDRELQIFRAFGLGSGTRDIAGKLGISVKTVETHRHRVREKLGFNSTEALRHAAIMYVSEELLEESQPTHPRQLDREKRSHT